MLGGNPASVLGEYAEHSHLAETFPAPSKRIPRKPFGENVTDKRLGAASAMASVQTLDDRIPVVLKVVDKLRKSLSSSLVLLFIYQIAESDKGNKIVFPNRFAYYALIG